MSSSLNNDPPDPASDGAQHDLRPRGGSRRTFLKRIGAGLAIAVPAFRVLLDSGPAFAAGRCEFTYNVYIGHYCSSGGGPCNSCVGPGNCVGEYEKFDADTGHYCTTWVNIECYACCGPTG